MIWSSCQLWRVPSPLVTSVFLLFTGFLGLSHLGPHWPQWSASQLCFSPMALLLRQVHRWLHSWLECRSVVLWLQPLPLRGWAMVSISEHSIVTVFFFSEVIVSGNIPESLLFSFYFLYIWAPEDGTVILVLLLWKGKWFTKQGHRTTGLLTLPLLFLRPTNIAGLSLRKFP